MNKAIRLLVTTMSQNIHPTLEYFSQYAHEWCTVHISHQITDWSDILLPEMLDQEWVHYYPSFEKWLSRSRNILLNHVEDGIGLICDDDIQLVPWFENILRQAYDTYPDAAVVTLQTQTPEWWLRKRYRKATKKHSQISILWVSSIEISFDIAELQKQQIRFDENFGLWTPHPGGEENIFLQECLDKWMNCMYYPAAVSIHPQDSSNTTIDWTQKRILFRRMHGWFFWILLVLALFLKKLLN